MHSRLRSEDCVLRFLITRPTRLQAEARVGDRGAREGRPSGRGFSEGRRPGQIPTQTLSNEALQEKIEEILQ